MVMYFHGYMSWHDTYEHPGQKSEISDSRSILNWFVGHLRTPKKKNPITKYHMSILCDAKTYPKPMSNDYNPCRHVTTECEICHETHKVRFYNNGVVWKQVKNGHKCTPPLKHQKGLSNTTTCHNKLPSIRRSKPYNDMKGNIKPSKIIFIGLNDQNLIDDQILNETMNDHHIEKNKNIHGVAVKPKVVHDVCITTDKEQHQVRFDKIVQVKTIPPTEQIKNIPSDCPNKRHVTFTSHVEVFVIPSNYEINTL